MISPLQALEKLQGHLAPLEQEFLANEEKHLTWKQQVCKHDPPAVGDFDPERSGLDGEGYRGQRELLQPGF